ncbi:peptidyl-prolyl cis-trans isomerase [Fomitiporia mediterranea MF3/22]|uniref:peptidyl-prolyl cis-trans isomerase n=1 Tax=Fomitiporia mediterranea (strain MF3/22) TaxID=694068 RepID=UPI0004407F71|nr:peptidyl-prolyl cis-trans isomerase [Fomitiporia mediterranea MF3/22]EJC97808.1 peptidyl-prolyl cis-trans isomerase [Fomitiporia mediterranea MF3/22]
MSDAEASVLGKRERDAAAEDEANGNSNNVTEDSDDDIGPMPMPADAPEAQVIKKKRKVLPHEKLYLSHLPSADRYAKSFMHRDVINFVVVTRGTDFVITTSIDGHLKLWKKQEVGIEFVKHYRAHLQQVTGVSASVDGTLFASISEDGTAKVFDVVNFDMINMIKLGFVPHCCCWVHGKGKAQALLAVSESNSGVIRIYDGRGDDKPLFVVDKVHRFPVHIMTARLLTRAVDKYNDRYDTVVSADENGFIEYWQPFEPFELPKNVPRMWEYKSSTDLFEFKKAKATTTCIVLSPDNNSFVTFSLPDRQIRIFSFISGKLTRRYDESLGAIQDMQQAGTSIYRIEDMEFGRRLAVDRELELPGPDGKVPGRWINAVWDESGNFVLYPTLLGIKVVNTVTNKVVRLLGKDETVRWMNLSLYQGAPAKKGRTTAAMAASANPILASKETRDPTLFCTGYKRQRFYMFTQTEPEDMKDQGDRDVFNERPTRDEQTTASAAPVKASGPSPIAHAATIHTSEGDIHIRLFPEHAPKAVENFVGHARSGYYEGIIFHRVIPKFMIQTGDPLGDGTGGDSIWGREFEDEFTSALRHDRPYTLSMANAGPNTNGSQFFITTTATPWLDNKHTIFGRVLRGLEVVHAIENVKTNKLDKPFEDIKIINVEVE